MIPPATEIPYGYCHCGCGGKTRLADKTNSLYGWVQGEPRRYVLGHQRRTSPVDYIEEPDSGCWIWQRSRDRRGYGVVRREGQRTSAHRYYYEKHRGPIPPGLHLDHLCRNPACCNPEHLEAVTNAVNTQRGRMAKLTPEAVREIRESGASAWKLAEKFGVSDQTVYQARNYQTWKNV